MTTDIALKIEQRSYQSPQRARAAVSRSSLSAAQKRKLGVAIQLWEDEGALEPPVVGGVPPAAAGSESTNGAGSIAERAERAVAEAELVEPSKGSDLQRVNGHAYGGKAETVALPALLNLNAFVRAHLTPFGMHILYTKRGLVQVRDEVFANGGVWDTTLAQFMVAFGQHLEGPNNDVPVVGFDLELYCLRP